MERISLNLFINIMKSIKNNLKYVGSHYYITAKDKENDNGDKYKITIGLKQEL